MTTTQNNFTGHIFFTSIHASEGQMTMLNKKYIFNLCYNNITTLLLKGRVMMEKKKATNKRLNLGVGFRSDFSYIT